VIVRLSGGGRAPLILYLLALLAVTAVWGWTFVLVKDAIATYPTLPFLALRFALAAALLAAVVRRLPSRRELIFGGAIGLALAFGYLVQTLGLQFISPGNAGLITGLFVVFTPLFQRFIGVPLRPITIAAVLLALAGAALLSGGLAGLGLGDLLVLGCAVAFAVHIVLLGRWAPHLSAPALTLVQLFICAFAFALGGAFQFRWPSPSVWFAIAVTGLLASALAFLIQTWVQRHLPPIQTALVLTAEPAWALLFAFLLAGQRLTLLSALGAGLVLLAIVGHEAVRALQSRAGAGGAQPVREGAAGGP